MDYDSKAWTMIQRHGPRFVVLSLVSQFKMQVICVSLYNLCKYGENRNTYKLLGDSCYTPKFLENSSITESIDASIPVISGMKGCKDEII